MSGRSVLSSAKQAFNSNLYNQCARTFATTLATRLTDVQKSSPRRAHQGRLSESKKKDAKLRHAINLYHLTSFFFPPHPSKAIDGGAGSPPNASLTASNPSKGQQASQKSASNTQSNDDRARDDFDKTLDSHIRDSILGTTDYALAARNFDSTVEMKQAHVLLSNQVRQGHTSRESSEQSQAALAQKVWPFGPTRSAAPKDSYSSGSTGYSTSSDGSDLPPLEDKEAVQQYIAATARRTALDSLRLTRQSSGQVDLDVRASQVRDALFGTVAGQLPGLEVLRERAQQRKLREEPATAEQTYSNEKKKSERGEEGKQ